MAYEDRILRMVRQQESAPFNDAKDTYRAETRGGTYQPKRPTFRKSRRGQGSGFGRLAGRGLGSFENQMMMDQLKGPAGMNLANQPQTFGRFLDLLKKFSGAAIPDDKPKIMPIPTDLGGAEGDFIGNTGYFNEPYFEMGSGIEYQAPSGGTRYTGVPFGDADYNLGRVYPDPNEVNRPVEKRQFLAPDPSEVGDFFMEPGYKPSPITTPFIPPDYEISPMEPYGDDGAYDTTRGDLGYAVGLDAFNKYNMYNPRQEGLDYTPPTQPRPRWDNPVGNFLRNLNRLFNRGGIASLRR